MCGIIVKLFEHFLNSASLMNEYHVSRLNSRVALLAIKELVQDLISNSCTLNAFKFTCHACSTNLLKRVIKPSVKTCFNIAAKKYVAIEQKRYSKKVNYENG